MSLPSYPHRIFVDSSKRISGSSSTEFVYPLQSTIHTKSTGGTVSLKSLNIPFALYNINTQKNEMVFYEDNSSKTAVLAPGNYDESDLADELARCLTASSSGFNTYSVNYNPGTF